VLSPAGFYVSPQAKALALANSRRTAVARFVELAISQGVLPDIDGRMTGEVGGLVIPDSSSVELICRKVEEGTYIKVTDRSTGIIEWERTITLSYIRQAFSDVQNDSKVVDIQGLMSLDEYNLAWCTFQAYNNYAHYLVRGYEEGFIDAKLPFESAINDIGNQWGIELAPKFKGDFYIEYQYPAFGEKTISLAGYYNGTKLFDSIAGFDEIYPPASSTGSEQVEGRIEFGSRS
jgi:hypothetical protein